MFTSTHNVTDSRLLLWHLGGDGRPAGPERWLWPEGSIVECFDAGMVPAFFLFSCTIYSFYCVISLHISYTMYNELSFWYAHAGQGLARRDIGGSGRWVPSKDWWIISRLTNYNVYWRIWWFWCLYFDSGRNKDVIYLSRQVVWVNCVGCDIVTFGPLGLLVNMDQLTPAQKTAVGKSYSDRLRLHLLKADYKLFTISEQTLSLRNNFCRVLSTWTRIRRLSISTGDAIGPSINSRCGRWVGGANARRPRATSLIDVVGGRIRGTATTPTKAENAFALYCADSI